MSATANGTTKTVSPALPKFALIDSDDFDTRAVRRASATNVGITIAYKAGYVDDEGIARVYTEETWARAVIANMTRAINDRGWGGSFVVFMQEEGHGDTLSPYVATNVAFLRYNPAEPHRALVECDLRGKDGVVYNFRGSNALAPRTFMKLRIRNRAYVAPMPEL